jgi:HAMP domain-containing protein
MSSRSLILKLYAGYVLVVLIVSWGVVIHGNRAPGLGPDVANIHDHAKSAALVLSILAIAVGAVVAWWLHRLITPIRQGAERFAAGDLANPIEPPDSEELEGLAHALNRMASQLSEKVQQSTEQGQEQQAVLASMIESVLAIDRQERPTCWRSHPNRPSAGGFRKSSETPSFTGSSARPCKAPSPSKPISPCPWTKAKSTSRHTARSGATAKAKASARSSSYTT